MNLRLFGCLLALLFAGVCSAEEADHSISQPRTAFQGGTVPPPNDRLYVQEERGLVVTTAVPSATESEDIFDANLYRRNIQPVWVQIENQTGQEVLLTPMGIDAGYYSPREVATRSFGERISALVTRRYEQSSTRVLVPPNSTQSGYVFTEVKEGTKAFNVDILGLGAPFRRTFFIPVPGLQLDHYDIDVTSLYEGDEIEDVEVEQLGSLLKSFPCCVTDSSGDETGDPLNIAFVGPVQALYYAFLRAGWDETETIYASSLAKTAKSALFGGAYDHSPVSALYFDGRSQDAAFQRSRGSIHRRNHFRIWLTHYRIAGEPLWIAQISRDIGVRLTRKTITTHKIDPDVDETREFLLEDLVYAQAVSSFGYVGGVGATPREEYRGNLTGDPFYTDGRRLVMWISEEPVAIDEVVFRDLQAAAEK
jgi:hypothetical protein